MVVGFEEKLELTYEMLKNKLFCSFATEDTLDNVLHEINAEYSILYKKIFVLSSPDSKEYMCTYNIEDNGKPPRMMKNTILVHRKKESNTLYTVNALNELIKKLNNGVQDSSFIINWIDYKNSILLSQSDGLKILKTQIHKIVNV
jgi:transcription initiation factor IIF auxiliary subunit